MKRRAAPRECARYALLELISTPLHDELADRRPAQSNGRPQHLPDNFVRPLTGTPKAQKEHVVTRASACAFRRYPNEQCIQRTATPPRPKIVASFVRHFYSHSHSLQSVTVTTRQGILVLAVGRKLLKK